MAEKTKSLALGTLSGIAGGLVGSWLMLHFIEGAGARLLAEGKREQDHREDRLRDARRQGAHQPAPDSVTMQAADVFAAHAPGGRHLSRAEREVGGTVVHYVFGVLMGAAYGATLEFWPLPGLGVGTIFGTVLWSGTDLLSLPAVGFAKWPGEEPPAAHLSHWLAHLVYGVGMEGSRRLVRKLL